MVKEQVRSSAWRRRWGVPALGALVLALALALAEAAAPGPDGVAARAQDAARLQGNFTLQVEPDAPAVQGGVEALLPWDLTGPGRVRLRDWRVALPWAEATVSLDAVLQSNATGVALAPFRLRAGPVRLAGGRELPGPVTVTGRLYGEPGWRQVRLEGLDIRAPGLLHATGALRVEAGRGLAGALRGEVEDAAALAELVGVRMLLPSGRTPFTLRLAPESGNVQAPGTAVTLELRPEGSGLALGLAGDGGPSLRSLTGAVDAELRLAKAGLRSWSVGSSLQGRLEPGTPDGAGQAATLELQAGGDPEGARLSSLRVSLPGVPGPGATLVGSGRVRFAGNATQAGLRLALGSEEAGGVVTVNATVPGHGEAPGARAELLGRDVDAAALAGLVQALLGAPLADWGVQGGLELAGKWSESGGLEMFAELRGANFSAPDGSALADGVATDVRLRAPSLVPLRLQADADVVRGECLVGMTYLDLERHPVRLSAGGSLEPGRGAVWRDVSLDARMRGWGRLTAQGWLSFAPGGPPALQVSARAEDLDLGRLFTALVQEPMAATDPDVTAWEAGGAGRLTLQARRPQGGPMETSGRLRIRKGRFTTGAQAEGRPVGVRGLEVDLPFGYRFGRAGPPPDTPGELHEAPGEWGEVSAEEVVLPTGPVRVHNVPVALSANRLQVDHAFALPLANGTVQVADIGVTEPLSSDFLLSCRARVQGLDLSSFSPAGIPLTGRLGGVLGRVRLSRHRLDAENGLQGEFFGGALEVSDIAMERPLARARTATANIRVERLHLNSLSRALNVGTVTGRMDVDLDDLAVAYGQPVAFDLRAESVPAKGVDQKISLKAVNAISVMGTGSGLTGAGMGLFASFFETFNYKKIGFTCRLDNDVFRVRGLIREGGVEYLVKKPPLFGINVINGNPENSISFSDMLGRLQRVLEGGAEDVQISRRAGNH